MTSFPARLSFARLAFIVTFLAALFFAFYTQHAWEDYYITFRSSKNLATGHGLVFNVGDKLHTFTSPLGVLLPALSYLLTFNSSDDAALWIFRLMSCSALGGAAAFLAFIAQRRAYGWLGGAFLIAALAMDAKILDFSINGMETAFMLLFLAYALWAHLNPGPRQWRHLGVAWGGLMWTRPDSFIYIGLIAIGFWLFNESTQSGTTRRKMPWLFVRAGVVTTAIYLPWLLFAHFYYGTAVPHTITAKSGIADPRTFEGLIKKALELPIQGFTESTSLKGTFLPSYYMIGGWPELAGQLAAGLAVFCAILWVLPFLRFETRVSSFAFFGAHVYLSYFPYFPFPWYLPATGLLALFTLGSLFAQLWQAAIQWRTLDPDGRRPRHLAAFAVISAALLLTGSGWLTWHAAHQLRSQQKYVEDGTRRKIGEWLRANAKPGDTVFMEPLGYIGYFSNLKTYDFPGMSSREMVAARKKVGNNWLRLIEELQPVWIVLRPQEVKQLERISDNLLKNYYQAVHEFSVTEKVDTLDVMGLPYLRHDSHFIVYRFHLPILFKTEMADAISKFDVSKRTYGGHNLTLVHAPGKMIVNVPEAAKTVELLYGFPSDAYAGEDPKTDGATFQIEWSSDERTVMLLDEFVNPVEEAEHRKLLTFSAELPVSKKGNARLIFRTLPGNNTNKDWTCWSTPIFQ
ncbi:hypothetical protein [Oleiharenicola lentus]|uniref:hypothetical protein n=1 Tax=Oleiharenicola lentus TaxID=2508720 RepID=UPI003F67E5A4